MSINTTNCMMNQVGLYTDLVNIVNDYTHGDKAYWRGKYHSVVYEMTSEFEKQYRLRDNDTIQARLLRVVNFATRKKIACVIQQYSECITDDSKTISIHDNIERYNVVGLHRIAFDRLVFRLKQMMRVKSYNIYHYKSNFPPSIIINITSKLMRHINDYNHTEYQCYTGNDSKKLWPTKINWGTRKIQEEKKLISKEVKRLYLQKQLWIQTTKDASCNTFISHYKLTNTIKISYVNNFSVRLIVNIYNGKPVEVTKKICTDRKTGRLYVYNPIVKRRRLYADEKYINPPSKMYKLYKNM